MFLYESIDFVTDTGGDGLCTLGTFSSTTIANSSPADASDDIGFAKGIFQDICCIRYRMVSQFMTISIVDSLQAVKVGDNEQEPGVFSSSMKPLFVRAIEAPPVVKPGQVIARERLRISVRSRLRSIAYLMERIKQIAV